jgi:glycerol-3-phosphate O-acyltransferase
VSERSPVAYEPNAALAWLYQRFFDHIEVDDAWASAVREADRRGTVVYVLRNLSFVDFFALDYLTKRLSLPQVRFANDLGLWILEPMGRGWLHALIGRSKASDEEDLRRTVSEGNSAALFLKRPAHLLDPAARGKGKIEGDAFIKTLFEVQRTRDRPILLVPQVFVWSKHQDQAKQSAFDAVLGPREWPGKIRTVAQFLMNYRNVTLRAGEPIDVQAFLASESGEAGGTGGAGQPSDEVLVRRITYSLLRRLERERHSVLGPTKKPADRLRAEVIRSPKLQKVIHDMAGDGEAERRVLTSRAFAMVREMEAALDMNAIAAWDAGVHGVLSRIYSGLELDEEGLARLRAATKDGSLILLPSHKSHLDYIFIAHVFYRNHLPVPVVAAGDNLSFFPLGPAFRRAGAFFIRRSFHGDRLYGAVVDAYMRRLIMDGWSMEFFLEGGRSRTGKLLTPKLGLLSLVVDAALGVTGRKIYFVPISIGYERIVEEEEYVRELSGGEKQKEDVRGLLATTGIFKSKYGRLNLQIGELLTMEGMLDELERHPTKKKRGSATPSGDASAKPAHASLTPARRRAMVTQLAYRVMNEINRVTAVAPGALVATALLTHGKRAISDADLVETCRRLARTLHGFGARFTPSLTSPHEQDNLRTAALREALDLFVRAGHVTVHLPGATAGVASPARRTSEDTIYLVPDDARLSLALAKNIIVHFFVARGLVATALLAPPPPSPQPPDRVAGAPSPGLSRQAVAERVLALSRLFKYEFLFRADTSFDEIFAETVAGMAAAGEVTIEGDVIGVGSGDGALSVALYAELIRSFLESYRIAARGLGLLLKGPLPVKDVTKRAIALGERMFLSEDIVRREAVSRPVIENAYLAFVDQGYLTRTEGKIALAASYATADAVKTIEARVVLYTPKAP